MNKCFNNRIFMFFLLFPFFNPTSLKYIPSLEGIYNTIQVWKIFSIIIIIIIYFLYRKFSSIIIWIVLFEIICVIISSIDGVHDSHLITDALLVIGISMVTEFGIRFNFKKFKNVLFYILYILAIVNFILCLIFPNGLHMAVLYDNWANPLYFLGIDNGIIKNLLPLLMISYYSYFYDDINSDTSSQFSKRKSLFYFLSTNIICFITMIIVGSSTGMTALCLFVILMLVYTVGIKKKYPQKLIGTLYTLFFCFIVLMEENFKIVDGFASIFGKNGGFTGRTLLWKEALIKISQKPFFGYGYTEGNINIWGGVYSSHNMFLEIMIQGGLVLFVAFILIVLYSIKNLKAASVQYSNLIFGTIFSYLVVGLMEVGIPFSFFMMLVLACYPDLKKGKNNYIFKIISN